MKVMALFSATIRKKLRFAGLLYASMGVLSALFYSACTSGSFYVLNTGQYMLEHNVDRQFLITSESKQPRPPHKAPRVPLYKVAGKYYVAAERVSVRNNVGVGGFIGEASPTPFCFYHRHEDEKAYYEVELTSHSGELFFSLPSGSPQSRRPAFTTLPADSSAVMAYFRQTPAHLTVTPAWDDSGQVHTYTCEKSGAPQLRLTDTSVSLSWRALYGLPAAAILCVAVDTPFNLMNFTTFCIRSIFD